MMSKTAMATKLPTGWNTRTATKQEHRKEQ